MERKKFCWQVTVEFKAMDMSGGDMVDGPRWTGKWIDAESQLVVVAPHKELAEAAARSAFFDHQHPAIKSIALLTEVDMVIQSN